MSAPMRLPVPRGEPTDAQLVSRVLGGEDDAYAALVDRHQAAIYRHARGMGLDHDTSADLVQESFIRAWDRLDDCRDGANYRSWLFRICRNLCLDELRNVRRQTVPISDLSEDTDGLGDPRGESGDLALALRAALESLPEALREAFLLKHDAGYTYEEIADIAEASPSAVKMRVHRARQALREFLEAEGVLNPNGMPDEGDNQAPLARLTGEAMPDRPASVAQAAAAPVPSLRRLS